MKALVTGFDPFGGDAVNPSAQAVALLPRRLGALAIETAVLPTSYARSAAVLRAAIDRVRPDLVLCVGQAGGRTELSLERVGINVQDARIRDNDGAGTFVCNHILYALMDMAQDHPAAFRGGFLHIPYVPEQAARLGGAPSMAVADIARGIGIILEVSARTGADLQTAEGQIS